MNIKSILAKVASAFSTREPTPYTDAKAWALVQRKRQAERKLRAEGYSRKQAVSMASMMYDKRGGKTND